MSDALRQAVDEIHAKIQAHLTEITDLKKAANALSRIIGTDPPYPDIELEQSGVIGPARADAYYGKPLSTAAREFLEFRKRACAPEEILKGLEQGGFDFMALGWTEQNRLRNLSISMAKNTAIFRRLPNGMFGLKAWYQDAPTTRRRGKGKTDSEADHPAPTVAQETTPQSDNESANVSTEETSSTDEALSLDSDEAPPLD